MGLLSSRSDQRELTFDYCIGVIFEVRVKYVVDYTNFCSWIALEILEMGINIFD